MIQYTLQNDILKVKVNSFGAELCSVISNENSIEYIWQANENVWARYAPNLFPIVGKLKEGKFLYQSKSYSLPQHGFARDNEFVCVEQSMDSLVFELNSSSDTLINYPFDFKFQIKYRLLQNKIEVSYSVFNMDSKEMCFSVGAHPAFNCPLLTDETFDDYELYFTDKSSLVINTLNDGLITSNTNRIELQNSKLPITKELFHNDALVFMNSQIDEVSLISKNQNVELN